MNYVKQVEIRWSDLDPNFHVKHSSYYDFGAYCRVAFLMDNDITPEVMMLHSLGPILFREECLFKREIKFGDAITIDLKLASVSGNYKKWTMMHEIFKNNDMLCAKISIDGAWMDTRLRKIISPPEIFKIALDTLPKTENFQLI